MATNLNHHEIHIPTNQGHAFVRDQKDIATNVLPIGGLLNRPNIQIQAFEIQKLKYTLLELELHHVLVLYLTSTGFSSWDLDSTHSNCKSPILLFIVSTSLYRDCVICIHVVFL